MASLLETIQWVAVDTETTGLNPYRHELVEIGAVRFTLQGITERFQVLIRPKQKFDPKARAINGITQEEIEAFGVELIEALPKFFAFLKDDILLFHNAPFDLAFLVAAAQKINHPLPKNKYYDHLYFSKNHFAERESHSLSYLRQILNIETGRAHRALSDAEATALIFLKALNEKAHEITSKRKFAKLMGKPRRISDFKLKIPPNLDQILKYFERYKKNNGLLKIQFTDKNGLTKTEAVQILDILIINQKIFLKLKTFPSQSLLSLPLQKVQVLDPERGWISFFPQKSQTT